MLRTAFACFALAGVGAAGFGAMVLFVSAADTIKTAPAQVDGRLASIQKDLDGQITGLRADVKTQAAVLQANLDGQVTTLRTDVTRIVDGRAGEAVGSIVEIAGSVAAIGSKLDVELDAAHTLTADIDGTINENRESARGLLRDSRVFMAEGARTSIYVRQQLPEFLKNAQESNRQWTGVTTDVHSLIGHIDNKFFGKRTFGQKVLGAAEFGLGVGSHAILFFK